MTLKRLKYARSNAKGRARLAAMRNAPLPKAQTMYGRVVNPWAADSMWAKGFYTSDAESAMSANSMNLATDIYAREGRKGNAQGQPKNYIQARTFNT